MNSEKKNKNLFLRFLRSKNTKISIMRDIFFALLFVLIILIALWAYTGQWFNAQPMVAIESNSMKHENEPFGRIGTIDAGDMVFLVKVEGKNDIITRGSESFRDNPNRDIIQSYGDYGDVIVYRPYGLENTDQIIHRAICWVDYNEKYNTYTVEEYGISNATSVNIPQIGLISYRPDNPHSGFITKGDNLTTNKEADQTTSSICDEPIRMEWISGKARGELPWIGVINLLFNDITQGDSTLSNVPRDSYDCLIILLESIILIPVSLDILSYYKDKKQEFLKRNIVAQKELNDLGMLTILYWFSMFVLLFVSYFLLAYSISNFYHFIVILFVHIIFLFLLDLEGKILHSKNMRNWLILTAISGPIGMTIYYLSELKRANKLN